MKKILLSLLGVLTMLPTFAQDFEYTYEGQTLTYTVISSEEKTCQTKQGSSINSSGNNTSGILNLPETVEYNGETYTLVSIGNYAFSRCTGLTSISIPESVTSIGDYAFYRCTGLTSISIPESVTSIGSHAFYECTSLTKAEFASVEAVCQINYGDWYANPLYFAHNLWIAGKEITELRIPEGVTSIGDYAFEGGSGLTSVIIGDSVESIGDYAFYECSGLTSVIIGDSVESIGDYAFYNCTGLTSVIIPPSVTSIGSYAFNGCKGLKKSAYPSNIYHLFSNGIAVSYDPTGAIIEDGWIYGPEKESILFAPWNLEGEYSIPNSVTSIASMAFAGCSLLTSISIPNSIKSIGRSAFSGCSDLTEITIESETPPGIDNDSWDDNTYNNVPLIIPADAVDAYLSTNWNNFKNIRAGAYSLSIFSDDVLSYRILPYSNDPVAYVTKGDYSSLTEVTIPERFTDASDPSNPIRYYVVGIEYGAFENLKNLQTVTFNRRSIIKNIEANAFMGCSRLKSINIPESVTSIGNDAFFGCSGLTKAEFASIEAMCQINYGNSYANPLAKAHNLWIAGEEITELRIPEGVTSIGNYAFEGGSKLTSISIPESVTSIGKYAFDGCSSLTKAEFASIEAMCQINYGNWSANPLYYAHNLWIAEEEVTEFEIPSSVNSIGSYAFYNCTGLTAITIPNSVQSIGRSAFDSCSGLIEVTIPNSVKSIGDYAFSGCTGLTSVSIGNSLESIPSSTFKGCSNITRLTIADGTIPLDWALPSSQISLYLGRPLKSLGYSSIRSLTVGNLLESISSSMFKNRTQLTSVTLGSGLKNIESEAFSGCTGLTEIVVPANVETIGESAFAGCSNLAKIVMGSEVKTIGDNAFNGTKATNVYITAQTPPTAPNTTFSNYSGKLWLQDPGDNSVIDAYYDAFTCWDRFDSYSMVRPESITVSQPQAPEDGQNTIRLSATLLPENVTLPDIFWISSNPEIATVDCNGLVTLQTPQNPATRASEDLTCKISARTLYANGPIAEVTVVNNIVTGIEIITPDKEVADGEIDYSAPYSVYSINGYNLGNDIKDLSTGIYIIRQGNKTKKIAVK